MLDHERCPGNQRAGSPIQVRKQWVRDRVEQLTLQRRMFLVLQELVEDRCPTARFEYRNSFPHSAFRFRHDREDQAHHDCVQRRIGKCKLSGIHDARRYGPTRANLRRSRCFSIAGVTSRSRQEVEVQTRSSADDQYAVARCEPQSVNRQPASGVESCCTSDGVIRRRPDRVAQPIPHDHASERGDILETEKGRKRKSKL
jgi:hypothetical protein